MVSCFISQLVQSRLVIQIGVISFCRKKSSYCREKRCVCSLWLVFVLDSFVPQRGQTNPMEQTHFELPGNITYWLQKP